MVYEIEAMSNFLIDKKLLLPGRKVQWDSMDDDWYIELDDYAKTIRHSIGIMGGDTYSNRIVVFVDDDIVSQFWRKYTFLKLAGVVVDKTKEKQ